MFVVLEWMDLSHSRKGHYRGFQNVLKSHVLEHITKAFRNGKKLSFSERFYLVLKSIHLGGPGMFVFQAFRNNTFSSRSEHKSFSKHCFWGVPQGLFFKHSGTAQFSLDQNTNHSHNIVFGEFRNVCFSSILEQHNFPQIRRQNIPETLFLGGSRMFVFRAFQNSTNSPRSEHKSFPKHCFQGVPECLFFKHSGTSQFPLDQNKNHSQNIVFREFRNVCFSSILEQHNFPLIRTQNIPKTLFLGNSGMFVFQAFRNNTISP